MKNEKVLIVEDDDVIRKFLRLQLDKWGYRVVEAEDGVQATLRLEEEDFDLIICDVMMPNKDGWEFIQEVRLSPKTKDIPVIFLTAKSKDSDMFKGYELGANYYITKPFTKAQLFRGIQLTLRKEPNTVSEIDVSQQYDQNS